MNKQELIEEIKKHAIYHCGEKECYKRGCTQVVDLELVLEIVNQLDEPSSGHAEEAPRCVKNVLARLRELPLHDREVWLKAIMSEFEQDFSHAIWREGYEQGKFEGMLGCEKVTIPQFIADKIEYCKKTDGYSLFHAMDYCYNFNECADWLESNEEVFARAWIFGYEVEKEKRYIARVKGIDDEKCYLKHVGSKWIIDRPLELPKMRIQTSHTRKELEEAGFGWVFDCPGIEIEEAEKDESKI